MKIIEFRISSEGRIFKFDGRNIWTNLTKTNPKFDENLNSNRSINCLWYWNNLQVIQVKDYWKYAIIMQDKDVFYNDLLSTDLTKD